MKKITIEFESSKIGRKAVLEMDGLSYFTNIMENKLPYPPINKLIDFIIIEVEKGRIVFSFTPGEQHYNPMCVVQGGVICTLLDAAASCAVHTALPAGTLETTIEFKVNYIKSITKETGPLSCEGKVLNLGKRIAVCEANLYDKNQVLYAHGIGTCMIINLP